ncbi:hypothetical protein B0H16DRAFT_1527180 [Mycena metata]|uniref:Uncharacterized protein n=1 Tax=Mycena metata TaxID=1033252 RepID=A0AAD7JHY6_9AGAR|nr:hypothetical protein B0H16DRAFT_1527180 [Mycena metata]
MLFRNLAVPAALFVHGAYATLTPDQVVTNINIVTTASQGILNAVTPITKNSSPGAVVTAGQTATTNFNTIIQNLGGDVSAMDGTVFTAAQAGPVCAALTDFVNVHQAVLSTVIGKHGFLAQFGVAQPLAAVLRTLEGAIDAFAFGAIAMLPSCANQVTQQQAGLDTSVASAISQYEEICVPSPLYPTVMPVCVGVPPISI